MHPRKKIRAAVKALFLGTAPDYPTAAESRVFDTMTPPVSLESLTEEGPVILAYTRNEEIRHEDYPVTGQDGAVKRRLDLQIEVVATGAHVDDTLDDIAEQIEALLEDWTPTEFRSALIELKDSEINVSDLGDRIFGGLFMSYEIHYYTDYRRAEVDDWIPDDVFVVPRQTTPPEQIVDDGDDGP